MRDLQTIGNFSFFTHKPTGLRCVIRKVSNPDLLGAGSHLCGYVEIRPDNIWYKRGEVECLTGQCDESFCPHSIVILADCHGGVTYAGEMDWLEERDALWVVGFDCNHVGDSRVEGDRNQKNFEYAVEQCAKLAESVRKWNL